MKTIVMTGGTSGFGRIAVREITRSPQHRLILGGRTHTAAEPLPPGVDLLQLDLGHLDRVRAFATEVSTRVDHIDSLVLNAGVIRPDAETRTADGFETTFAVNHLAHYLMLRLLLPTLANDATVVLTTSGTHDPATGAGLATPRHADAHLLAHPDEDPDRDTRPNKAGEHAYTASKLCAVLTSRALSEHPDVRSRRLSVVAYDPGQVFGTGLTRDLSLPLRTAWALLGTPVFGWPIRRFNRNLNTRESAGKTLADLALGHTPPPDGHAYAALRRGRLTWPEPSDLARDDRLANDLWNGSAALVGPRSFG